MKSVPLGDVCRFVNGGTPSKAEPTFWGGDIPWITSTDIDSPIVTGARSHVTPTGIDNSATTVVPKGSLLLVTRTSVGKVAFAGMDLCFSQDINACVPARDRLDVRYLAHFLRMNEDYLTRNARGATIKGITKDALGRLEIPLPPLAEQKRIAAVLDKADDLRGKRRQALATLDTLLQSVFVDLFGDPVTNPKGWPARTIADVLSLPLRNGVSPASDGTHPGNVLTLSAITGSRFDPLAVKDAMFSDELSPQDAVDERDLLICRGNGNLNLVGRAFHPTASLPDTRFPDTMIAARVRPDAFDPEYLEFSWNAPSGRMQVEALARTTNGTHKINQTAVKSVRLLAAPTQMQRRFGDVARCIKDRRNKLVASEQTFDSFFASLQSAAFAGTLFSRPLTGTRPEPMELIA